MRAEQPFFSIIIPTYARPGLLGDCLQSLTRLDYPRSRFEVIVVDDGGDPPLDPVLDPFRRQIDLKLVRQAHLGPAAARNAGAAVAKGRFLAFTDDDCRPAPDWLQVLALRFVRAPDAAIGGLTLNALTDNPCSTVSLIKIAYLVRSSSAETGQARFLCTSNLAVPADRFQASGGFDTVSFAFVSEDRDFCDRWLHHGYPMVYAPEAVVYHAHALNLQGFMRQQFNYGRGSLRFHRARAARRQQPLRLAGLSFSPHPLYNPFQQSSDQRAWQLCPLLVLARLANAAGFLWEAVAGKVEEQGPTVPDR